MLCGPFVDVNHPKLCKGDVDMETDEGIESVDYDTFFNIKISGILEALYEENPDTKLQVSVGVRVGGSYPKLQVSVGVRVGGRCRSMV